MERIKNAQIWKFITWKHILRGKIKKIVLILHMDVYALLAAWVMPSITNIIQVSL